MTSLPPNDELQSCIEDIYLGDLEVASQVQWLYSKTCCCYVLALKSTPDGLDPPSAILHGCFKFVQNSFYLLPDGGFNIKIAKEHFGKTSDEDMAKANAWAHLEQVTDHNILGYDDFPVYIKNLNTLESLLKVCRDSKYSIIHDGPQVKIIHQMFKVYSLIYVFHHYII